MKSAAQKVPDVEKTNKFVYNAYGMKVDMETENEE